MKNEIKVSFLINEMESGSGTVIVRDDGSVSTEGVEEEFYKTLRKFGFVEKAKEDTIDSLTKEQEEKLRTAHAEDYHGTDDDMPDDYENWLMELSYQEIVKILK